MDPDSQAASSFENHEIGFPPLLLCIFTSQSGAHSAAELKVLPNLSQDF